MRFFDSLTHITHDGRWFGETAQDASLNTLLAQMDGFACAGTNPSVCNGICGDGMRLGLGSGSTSHAFVRALGERVADGLDVARAFGAEGIGLFRTELQFMIAERMPSSTEQQALYQAVFAAVEGKPVTFRTLDIGGDKILPYMRAVEEENPALGWRAIRIGLDRPALLRAQAPWLQVKEWLPEDPATRDQALIGAIGASDPLQLDGLGGNSTLNSKVAIVSRSARPDRTWTSSASDCISFSSTLNDSGMPGSGMFSPLTIAS